MANNTENNDQEQQLNPDMQLAFNKESNRHAEEMARIEATSRQEDRKIDLDERRVVCQEKEVDARLKTEEAKNETANSIRMSGFTALTETLKWVRETVFPTVMKEKTMKSIYYQAVSAARSGIATEIDWNTGKVSVCPMTSAKVGCCFFNLPSSDNGNTTAQQQPSN